MIERDDDREMIIERDDDRERDDVSSPAYV